MADADVVPAVQVCNFSFAYGSGGGKKVRYVVVHVASVTRSVAVSVL